MCRPDLFYRYDDNAGLFTHNLKKACKFVVYYHFKIAFLVLKLYNDEVFGTEIALAKLSVSL